jgi:hypothetical protein
MSQPRKQFTAQESVFGQDLRIQIGGPGRKNALLVTLSYRNSAIASAFDDSTFYGRLVIFEGIDAVDQAQQYLVTTPIALKILLDVDVHTAGVQTFLLPLTNLEGNPQTSEGGILNVILCAAQDKNSVITLVTPTAPENGGNITAGTRFIGKLSIGGQTLPYGGGQ